MITILILIALITWIKYLGNKSDEDFKIYQKTMTDQQIKDYVSTNFLITQIGNVCEIECNTEFDKEVLKHIASAYNVWKSEKKLISVRGVSRRAIDVGLFLHFQKRWKGVETPVKLATKNYCDIIADGEKFLAKVHEKDGLNEPCEVLYKGKWIMIEEFNRQNDYSSQVFLNYRKFKDPNKKENG
jgi:hypothetical protein